MINHESVLFFGQEVPLKLALLLPHELEMLSLIVNNNPVINHMDGNVLLKLAGINGIGQPLCNEFGLPTTFPSLAMKRLRDWMDDKETRALQLKVATIICSIYMRHKITAIPCSLGGMFVTYNCKYKAAHNFYHDVKTNVNYSESQKRVIFCILCRGLTYRIKDGDKVIMDNDITNVVLSNRATKEWPHYNACLNVYSLIDAFSAADPYHVNELGRNKRAKTEADVTDVTTFYSDKFLSWCASSYPDLNISFPPAYERSFVKMCRYYLWETLVPNRERFGRPHRVTVREN